MGYYDGNTVTGLWNYAQYYGLNDNFSAPPLGPHASARLTWRPE